MPAPVLVYVMTPMAIDFTELGERLRAYRMGASLTPEEVAKHLRISRAALYNYEKGGVIKLETIERLAALLQVSVPSLLGAGVEYFTNPVVYFERKRQVEKRSEQVFVFSEPVSILLLSPNYPKHLRQMLIESGTHDGDRAASLQQINSIIGILEERREERGKQRLHLVTVISAPQIQRFVRTGVIGTYDLPADVLEERRRAACAEVEHIASLVEREPMGVQIGVSEVMLPTYTFEVFRQREKTTVAISPFRLGEFPNIRFGVASMTADEGAVAPYEALAEDLWTRSHRGLRGAELLRNIVAESMPKSGRRSR